MSKDSKGRRTRREPTSRRPIEGIASQAIERLIPEVFVTESELQDFYETQISPRIQSNAQRISAIETEFQELTGRVNNLESFTNKFKFITDRNISQIDMDIVRFREMYRNIPSIMLNFNNNNNRYLTAMVNWRKNPENALFYISEMLTSLFEMIKNNIQYTTHALSDYERI